MRELNVVANRDHPQQDVNGERPEDPGRIRYRFALKLLPRPSMPGEELLDAGGGRAEFARLARDAGWRVTLADANPRNVDHAAQLGFGAHRLDLNAGLAPFRHSQFAGAVCLDVIEHLVSAEQMVRELARVVEPGGFLLLSTPNVSYWAHRCSALRGRVPPGEGYHYRFFNAHTLRRLLVRAGFEPECWGSFAVSPLCHLTRRGRPAYFRIPASMQNWMAGILVVRGRRSWAMR